MSKEAADKLAYQMSLQVESTITPAELLKKSVINPSNKEKLPVLPGFFVEAGVGTGW